MLADGDLALRRQRRRVEHQHLRAAPERHEERPAVRRDDARVRLGRQIDRLAHAARLSDRRRVTALPKTCTAYSVPPSGCDRDAADEARVLGLAAAARALRPRERERRAERQRAVGGLRRTR